MQIACLNRRLFQPSRTQGPFNSSQQLGFLGSRWFASRHSGSSFSADKSLSVQPRQFKEKPPSSRGNKSPNEPPKTTNESKTENTSDSKPPRRLRLRPGKVILFSILALLGYRFYRWQTNPHRSLILNYRFFTPFILEQRVKVSSTSCILNLKSVPAGQNTDMVTEAWKSGVWSVQVIQPELQISRPYTPLPPKVGAEPEELRLFVRLEPHGEVSTFLHKIYRGTFVHMRGPRLEYEIPTDVDEILFLAGGTGIAPALQVAHTLFNYRTSSAKDRPKLHILWANRRREDSYRESRSDRYQHSQDQRSSESQGIIRSWLGKPETRPDDASETDTTEFPQDQTPLVEELQALKLRHPDELEIEYFVDENNSYITESTIRQYISRIDRSSDSAVEGQPARKKIILISGPNGFVSFYAGPKFMSRGREIQGPLAGILQKIDPKGWEVWKL